MPRHLPALLAALLLTTTPALAEGDAKPPASAEKKGDDAITLPPLPADRSVAQSLRIGGRTIGYRATVGTLAVRERNCVGIS